MPPTSDNNLEQDKLARFDRIKKAITALEKQQQLLLRQGELAPSGAWVARYQVRQNTKRYWYYKLQTQNPYFQCAKSSKLSKYKHLGKAGSQAHIDPTFRTLTVTEGFLRSIFLNK